MIERSINTFNRRQFVRGLVVAGVVAASSATAYADLVEPYNYEVTEREIFIRDLPQGFDGFRITQVSDVHHSRIVSIEEVRRVVVLAQRTRPDMFALTGDYTTLSRRFIHPCVEELGRLSAPEGVWAVLGNHDHKTGARPTVQALEEAHINVIDNRNTIIRRGVDELQLAGVGDWLWAKDDWGKALGGVDQNRPTILLSHQPHVFDLPHTKNVSLILSGHTHGGQISFPLIGSPIQIIKQFHYVRGLYKKDGAQLYVSRGTGMIGVPLRFGARPEIAVLRLRRAA